MAAATSSVRDHKGAASGTGSETIDVDPAGTGEGGEGTHTYLLVDNQTDTPVAWTEQRMMTREVVETEGTIQLFAADVESGDIRQVSEGVHNYYGFSLAEGGGAPYLIGQRVSMSAPAELYRVDARTGEKRCETLAASTPIDRNNSGVLPDVLMSNGTAISMRLVRKVWVELIFLR